MRLWLDVEDLFEYARTNYRRPSGIQRLAFEIYRELQARYGATGQVCFVRHSLTGNSFQAVHWSEVAALFAALANSDATPASHSADAAGPALRPVFPHVPFRGLIRRLAHRLSPSLRADIINAVSTQSRSLRAWGRLTAALARGAARTLLTLARRPHRPDPTALPFAPASDGNFENLAAPGDTILLLAAALSHPNYADLIRRRCKAKGLRFALMLCDLVPLRHPEWCDRSVTTSFRNWIDAALPLTDNVFAISHATAADTEAYAREQGIALPGPVITLPIGSTKWRQADHQNTDLPPPGSYALFVSTIEARKNHLLLFRVWQHLLQTMPPERVPTLVFAGRVGWLVDDLMQQITNTQNLNGKLLHLDSPTDSELAALYDGCLFTLFPSFFEGWGLPVTESLAFGKPCIISNRASLPEAGGKLARSFDPDNLHDACAVIREVIEDPAALARWQTQVRREFRPTPWSATVDALLGGLGYPWAAASTIAAVPASSPAPAANRAPAHAK